MAQPLNFKPKPMELSSAFHDDLERAPKEHTEALLNLYALLEEAHERGWLDAARGVMAGAPVAATQIAKYAKTQESIAMVRNLVSLAKILGSLDPEVLHAVSVSIANQQDASLRAHKPSLSRALRSLTSADVLRGVVFTLGVVAIVGKALQKRRPA